MCNYIYSKGYGAGFADVSQKEGSVMVFYYSSATEVALMHFLNFLQKEDTLYYLSEKTQKKYQLLASEFVCSDCLNGILCASIFFLSRIDDDIINEFNSICNGKLGCKHQLINFSELNDYFEHYGYAIKNVNIIDETKVGIPSYCSIIIPAAYMLRSTTDRDGYFKRWPSDYIIDEVMIGLRTKGLRSANYSHINVLVDAICLLAEIHNLDSVELNLMVQSLLVNNLISLYLNDRNIIKMPFNEIVNALFEEGW